MGKLPVYLIILVAAVIANCYLSNAEELDYQALYERSQECINRRDYKQAV